MRHTEQDVLVGILSNYVGGHYNYDPQKLIKFFYDRKSTFTLLKHFSFDSDGIFVNNDELDTAYNTLITTGIISCSASRSNPHHINDACKIAFDKFVKPRFNRKELKELFSLNQDFNKECYLIK